MPATVLGSLPEQATRPLPSVQNHVNEKVKQMFDFIIAQGDADYIGEAISQLEHSLQCADQAVKANADNETVLAALLHDVGRFIPAATKMEKLIWKDGTNVGIQSHEVLGENYLRDTGFSEKICQLVGAHVVAKRYLTAVDKDYYNGLSESSKRTLKFQGGCFTEEQVKEAQKDPWLQEKLAVRRWDDLAKVPDLSVPNLATYEPIACHELLQSSSKFSLHGRTYNLPTRPTVVLCIDGFDPAYLEHGRSVGILPTLSSFSRNGFHTTAKCAMPSFPNSNNVSILTGVPLAAHHISGNAFVDPEAVEEHMNLEGNSIQRSTILEPMQIRGVRVAAITAKDKLRKILSRRLNDAICLSIEKASELSSEIHSIVNFERWLGKSNPSQFSAELPLYILDAGVKLLQEDRADLIYLTLADSMQHRYAPGEQTSDDFFKALDERIGQLVRLGADVAVTSDQGITEKSSMHSGLSEQDVPLMMSRPVKQPKLAETKAWRNYDIFDLVLNY